MSTKIPNLSDNQLEKSLTKYKQLIQENPDDSKSEKIFLALQKESNQREIQNRTLKTVKLEKSIRDNFFVENVGTDTKDSNKKRPILLIALILVLGLFLFLILQR